MTLTPLPEGGAAAIARPRLDVCAMVTRPAGCGFDGRIEPTVGHPGPLTPVPLRFGSQPGAGIAESEVPIAPNSTPAEAVVSFATMVLLIRFTLTASCKDTPPPS